MRAESIDDDSGSVTIQGRCTDEERSRLRNGLTQLKPWRKGPFSLFDVELDAEWRSDKKWARVAPHVDLGGKLVLDIGCGNGYYGWRMLAAGAERVVGLEPYPLYNFQHAAIKRFAPDAPNFVIPGSDQLLFGAPAIFDVTFSMGVLYHCRNAIGHLDWLRRALKPGGQLVLETLVVSGDSQTMFFPPGRYAKMRNVWFIPSSALLCSMLARCGFKQTQVIDETVTTIEEQRATDWMDYESLVDFLDPQDARQTIEGHPRPRRAVVVAN